jgi:Ca-activated chloride channel family protein
VNRAKLAREVQDYRDKKRVQDDANRAFKGEKGGYQSGRLGVDLAQNSSCLREQSRISLTANRQANGRQVLEVGGVWIDDAFKSDMKTVVVKSQSDAYFKILEKHAAMKDVYRLGNHVVWVAPSGTALVLDQNNGKEALTDAEIEALFAKK